MFYSDLGQKLANADMSFEFPIPLSRDDLTRKSGVHQYVVDEVFPIRLLPAKLQGIT